MSLQSGPPERPGGNASKKSTVIAAVFGAFAIASVTFPQTRHTLQPEKKSASVYASFAALPDTVWMTKACLRQEKNERNKKTAK
jgi:hypothetical protein